MAVSCSLSVSAIASSVNIANNTSRIAVTLTATTTGDSHNLNDPGGTITVNGSTYTYYKDLPYNSTVTLYSNTFTIQHNTDGSKTVGVSYSFNTGISAGTLTGSKNLVLVKIARGPLIRNSGVYARALVYIRVDGEYRLALPYIKSENKYKLGVG